MRSPNPVLGCEGVRELGTKQIGFTDFFTTEGDGNSPDYSELALANLDMIDDDQAVQDAGWEREIARRHRHETGVAREINLTAEEWDNFPSEDNEDEIEVESDDDREIEYDEDGEVIYDSKMYDGEIEETDEVGSPIYDGVYVARKRDRYDDLADSLEAAQNHELVRKYGFKVMDLLGLDYRLLGAEMLAVVSAGCKAADELANLAGDSAVLKVLGWKNESPRSLAGFGVDLLFRNAGALQGAVEAIEATRRREAEAKAKAKPGLVLPARKSTAPARNESRGLPPAPTKLPGTNSWGRISTAHGVSLRCVCGCGQLILESLAVVPSISEMRQRQVSRVQAADLWRHVLTSNCARRFGVRFYSITETRERIQKDDEQWKANHAAFQKREQRRNTRSNEPEEMNFVAPIAGRK